MEVPGRLYGLPSKEHKGRTHAAKDSKVFCQPCSSDEECVFAVGYCQNCGEYFCQACLKLHRKQSMSKHHVILEGEKMPQKDMQVEPLDTCSKFCSQHTNEIIKFYCPAHDDVGCGDCMVLDHKSCEVDRIQDISRHYYNGQEHIELQRKVDQLQEDIKNIAKKVKETDENKNEAYSKALHEITAFRKEINDHFDKAEAEITAAMTRRKEKDEELLSTVTEEKQHLERDIVEIHEKLHLQSNKANEVFVEAKKIKKQMEGVHNMVKQMYQLCLIDQYRFEESSDIRNIIASDVSLGLLTECKSLESDHSEVGGLTKCDTRNLTESRNLEHDHSEVGNLTRCDTRNLTESRILNPPDKKLEDMEPEFESEIQIKSPKDKSDCVILASAIISPSHIVLADCANYCVKLVDIEQKKIIVRHRLNSQPKDVVAINENQIAVLLPDEQKIQILTLTDHTFTADRHIKVQYWGGKILFQNGTFITAYDHGVDILDTDGDLIKTIPIEQSKALKGIAFSPDSKSFYATYFSPKYNNIVRKYDLAGNRLAAYVDANLQSVRGITVAKDGTVFVCNYGINFKLDHPNSGSIHILSPDCKEIKEVLKESGMNPFCISICDETNKLFLCNKCVIFPYRNNVLAIFQLKYRLVY